ncbi:MAG: flagellar biosynthesis protein FliQ [Sphingomonas oligoaromativorans]
MDAFQAAEFAKASLVLTLTLAGPMLLASLVVGVAVGLFQALTQVQESTLTFVPKIVAILVVTAITGPFVGAQISSFSNVVFQRIQNGF